MKYIKTYENVIENLIDKFVVYRTTSTTIDPITKKEYQFLFIFKIKSIDEYDTVTVKRYYEYDTMLNKLKNSEIDDIKGNINILLENTLFSSDNLQDCVDMLPVLSDINKYNL